jgi:CheY-like chemotaxis protein
MFRAHRGILDRLSILPQTLLGGRANPSKEASLGGCHPPVDGIPIALSSTVRVSSRSPVVLRRAGQMGARRVLVIEDETSAREALVSLLMEEGYQVRSASSGQAGLDCFGEFHPDVVVCDYYLPDLDGLQVLRSIRGRSVSAVRFIMVTAGLSGIANERALRQEADAFLGKPIDLVHFSSLLRAPDGGHSLNAPS